MSKSMKVRLLIVFLVMLMHLEDQEAWKKIYTTVKTLTNEVFE